jgi:transposase
VECEEHKVEQLPLSFAEKNSRYTVLFEAFVLEWLKSSPVSAVSKSFRLGWDATDGIMQRAVERGVSRRKTSTPQAIGIEETSGSKGRKYITIIPDKDQDCVIEVVEDRKAETPENWLKTREICDLSGVKSVSMDMWDPYIKAVKACRADAEKKIGFERFHGAQHFNRTPDKVRAGEHREQQKLTGTSPLTRSRFGWFEEFGAYGQSQQQEKRVFEVIAFESGNRPGVEDKRACGQSVGLCVDGSSRGGMEEAVVVDKSLPHCGDHPGGEDDTKLSLGDTQCDTVTDNQQHAGS